LQSYEFCAQGSILDVIQRFVQELGRSIIEDYEGQRGVLENDLLLCRQRP
jgi:hypothetical protein